MELKVCVTPILFQSFVLILAPLQILDSLSPTPWWLRVHCLTRNLPILLFPPIHAADDRSKPTCLNLAVDDGRTGIGYDDPVPMGVGGQLEPEGVRTPRDWIREGKWGVSLGDELLDIGKHRR